MPMSEAVSTGTSGHKRLSPGSVISVGNEEDLSSAGEEDRREDEGSGEKSPIDSADDDSVFWMYTFDHLWQYKQENSSCYCFL